MNSLKAQVLAKLEDACAEAQNDNFDAAAMWASLAAEEWNDSDGAVSEGSGAASKTSGDEEGAVRVAIHPEEIEGENVREFHPEAVGAATGALEHMLEPGSKDHRDADIIASCAVSEALKALVIVAQLGHSDPPLVDPDNNAPTSSLSEPEERK